MIRIKKMLIDPVQIKYVKFVISQLMCRKPSNNKKKDLHIEKCKYLLTLSEFPDSNRVNDFECGLHQKLLYLFHPEMG